MGDFRHMTRPKLKLKTKAKSHGRMKGFQTSRGKRVDWNAHFDRMANDEPVEQYICDEMRKLNR
jgi:ribosomal protein RSM22 (predicted rRNA methylase)